MPAQLNWRTSTYSSQTGQCVELAPTGKAIAIRDTKDRGGPVLRFTATGFQAFIAAVRDGGP